MVRQLQKNKTKQKSTLPRIFFHFIFSKGTHFTEDYLHDHPFKVAALGNCTGASVRVMQDVTTVIVKLQTERETTIKKEIKKKTWRLVK